MIRREELFSKALKVEAEEIKAHLLCEVVELTDAVRDSLINEVGIKLSYSEFYSLVVQEAEQRHWDLRYFRNSKNEPVTNLFKRVIRNLCEARGAQLSNDNLSRLLNIVRKHYGEDGILSAGIFPAEAFRQREKYGIPYDLGDTNSCFREGGCNEGNSIWLENEDKEFNRVKLVIFHYQNYQNSRVGVGRCWVFQMGDALYATNFYGMGVDLKDKMYKFTIVRLLRKLFGLSENVKFKARAYNLLPVYTNSDGIVIYDPTSWENSEQVLEEMGELWSVCMWCRDKVQIKDLRKYDEPIYYEPAEKRIQGLVVCRRCQYDLDNLVECKDCGELINSADAYYVDGVGYICESCFNEGWFYCSRCEEPTRIEYRIITPDGEWYCEGCASRIGAIEASEPESESERVMILAEE
jgi:hypothetical protein